MTFASPFSLFAMQMSWNFGSHGSKTNFACGTFERNLSLAPGEHVLEASVAKLGRARPAAQTTWKAGFVLKASGTYDAQLTTGKAAWQAADLEARVRPTQRGQSLF